MNTKALITLTTLTAFLVAVAAFVLRPGAPGGRSPFDAPLVPDLAERATDLTAIEITTPSASLRLEREGDTWTLPANDGYPADLAEIRRLVTSVQTLTPIERKTSDPANHARLGLDLPERTAGSTDTAPTRVRLLAGGSADASDVIADLVLGNTTPGGAFVRAASSDQTWLVAETIDARTDATAWFDARPVQVERTEVARVTIEHPTGPTITIVPDPDTPSAFVIEDVPEGKRVKGPWLAGQTAGALGFLSVLDVRAADAIGFDDVPPVIVTFTLNSAGETATDSDASALTVHVAEINGTPWVTFRSTGPGADAADAVTQGWAYEIAPFTRDALARTPEDLFEDEPTTTTGDEPTPPAVTAPGDG
jgi:hypothetical protein